MRSANPVLPDRAPPRTSTCPPMSSSDSASTQGASIGRRAGLRQVAAKSCNRLHKPLSHRHQSHYGPRAPGRRIDVFGGWQVTRYYLGVDGGGTNCRIRLADENLVTLADANGGRSNLQIDAGEPAFRSISE